MKSLLSLCAVVLLTAASAQHPATQAPDAAPTLAPIPGWTAQWIAAPFSTPRDGAELDGSHPMPVFRKSFTASRHIASARFRIAGLGQWQATLTSADKQTPIAPPGLHQSWTDYRKTVTFEQYDLTPMLKPGPHVLTIALGNGMYNVQHTKGRYTKFEGSFGAPRLIAELRITYKNGKTETIASDASWQAAPGPTLFSSTYGGEDFDARKLTPPPGAQQHAIVVAGPGGTLIPAIALEVGEAVQHQPIAITHPTPSTTVFDLGQNFAGVPLIHVHGPAGATLKLTPGELLKPDGSVTQQSSGGPMWWTYILRGDPAGEQWNPSFGYYGFRYLQAEWVTSAPGTTTPVPTGTLDTVTGIEWHSSSPITGSFASSSPMLNAIHHLIVSAMHNNEVSLFTDCPHREKLGWLEETHLVASGLLFNNDLTALFRATDRNIADAQYPDGMVPTIAPQYTKFGPRYAIYDDSPEWGSAAILAPWTAFRFNGDRGELERTYPTMQRYLAYLQGRARDGIVAYGLGDWYDIGPNGPGFENNTTLGVTATLMLYQDAQTLSQVATLLNHPDDAARYATLARQEATAFNARFWNPQANWYDTGSQTANAMPLDLGIAPPGHRAAVLAHILADIHAHQDHITTGEVGFPYLVRALTRAGRSDVLYAILMRRDPPSYGSQLAAGATSLTEAWDANPHNSQDHFMLGGAEEWFFRGLGGIDLDFSRPDPLTIQPRLVADVSWARVGYTSTLGPIEVDWQRTGPTLAFTITLPTDATVILPATSLSSTETIPTTLEDNELHFRLTPGTHHLTIPALK
jgi:alpha-L-rhamnosidase